MLNQPKITISSLDMTRLEAMLAALPQQGFPGRNALEAELARADVLEPADMPPDVVTMNSTVHFAVGQSEETFAKTLVYPKDAQGEADHLSILAPVGAALLGLRVGDEIDWPTPAGKPLRVKLLAVDYQPERAGELHR